MERLKIVLLVAAIVSTSQISQAQQTSMEASPRNAASAAPSYTIIGDVRDPRTLAMPSGRLTIRSAVLQAQPFANPVSVSVLRRTQERALWTQLISTETADTGEFVAPGDVLVVQAMNAFQAAVQQNAAIRTNSGVLVVLLSDESVAIGDILQQTVGLPTPDQQVTIPTRFQGRPSASKVTLASVVAHGDVINVGLANQKVLKGFGSLAPAFSERTSEADTVTIVQPETVAAKTESVTTSQTESPAMEFPAEFYELSEPAEPILETPAIGDSTSATDDVNEIPVQAASQSSVTDATAVTEVAPNPPEAQPTIAAEQVAGGGLSFWNLVVIGGLIVAGILLLAGSLSEEDDADVLKKQVAQQTSRMNRNEKSEKKTFQFTPALDNSQSSNSNSSAERQTLPLPASTNEKAIDANPISSVTITKPGALNPETLVKPTEWFSGEWRNSKAESTSSAATNIPKPAVTETVIRKEGTTTPVIAAETDNVLKSKLSIAEAERLESVVRSIASEGRKNAEVAPEPVASSTEFSDLEDLLQNRLPVDLCEAQLPLRIALFGRPAGPRRLRIDAAHPTLSGPHTHLNSDRRQDDRLPAAAAKSESWRLDSMTQEEGLDRALNSLQDRTNS